LVFLQTCEASSQLIHAVGELQGSFTLQDGADIGGDKADAYAWKLIVRNFHSQLVDETNPSAAPEEQFKCAFGDHPLAVNRVLGFADRSGGSVANISP
jgi:hypothetical protein